MARDTVYSLDETKDHGGKLVDLIDTDDASYAELVELREENALLKRETNLLQREILRDLGVYRYYLHSQLRKDR